MISEFSMAYLEAKRKKIQRLSGGVIFEVASATDAKLAEDAGAKAVILGSNNNSQDFSNAINLSLISSIKAAIEIPLIAKCRIGHFVEARILQELGVDILDENGEIPRADEEFYIQKRTFNIPFSSTCETLSETLLRIIEGAVLIRSPKNAPVGHIAPTVRYLRRIFHEIEMLTKLDPMELMSESEKTKAPIDLLKHITTTHKLPILLVASGGIETPADVALVRSLGADVILINQHIFQAHNSLAQAESLVKAAAEYQNDFILLQLSH